MMKSDVVFNSGEKKISKTELDNFIKDYQNKDFLEFKNVVISAGLREPTRTTYTINKGDLPMYFVSVNESKNEITGIINPGLKQQKVSDYFSQNQITDLIHISRKLNFCFLSVNNNDDVFINPFYPSNSPCLIRSGKTHAKREW